MNGYTQSMVVAHQSIPASLPMVAAHTSKVVAVVVANDLVTMWLVIGCLQLVFLDHDFGQVEVSIV